MTSTSFSPSHHPARATHGGGKEGDGHAAGSQANTASTSHITKHNIAQLSYYEVFHIDPCTHEIDTTALRREYRRYSLMFHPDKDGSPEARAAFDVVAHALETLSDPALRKAYDAAQRQAHSHAAEASSRMAGGASAFHGAATTTHSAEAERLQRAEEDARSAEYVLRQKEQAYAMQSAEAERDREARSAAARRMLDELTNSLETPFQQMESALIDEWDINEELLDMKVLEVERLLAKVRDMQGADEEEEEEGQEDESMWGRPEVADGVCDAHERKRSRDWHDGETDVAA